MNGPTGGDSHVTTPVMGTYGYAAPEYVATGTQPTHLLPHKATYDTGLYTCTWGRYQMCRILTRLRSSGHLYVKSDVYGFGVVLLEMLTGLRARDTTRPEQQRNLVDWAKPYLADRRKVARLVDRRLEGQYPSKAALRVAANLTLRCLSNDPKSRPSMAEVVAVLEEIERMKAR